MGKEATERKYQVGFKMDARRGDTKDQIEQYAYHRTAVEMERQHEAEASEHVKGMVRLTIGTFQGGFTQDIGRVKVEMQHDQAGDGVIVAGWFESASRTEVVEMALCHFDYLLSARLLTRVENLKSRRDS